MDAATLVIVVDSTSAERAAADLDRLSAAGARTEANMGRMSAASKAAGAGIHTATNAAAQMTRQAQAQAGAALSAASGLTAVGGASQLAAHHAQNLAFQFGDVIQGFAIGQRPMQIAAQQGFQIAQIMGQAGLGVRGLAVELARMTGVIKVSVDAVAAADAAAAAGAAKAVAATAARAAGNVAAADTELLLATSAIRTATTSEALSSAQTRLALAHQGVAVAAREAAIAEDALAIAQGRAAQAGNAAAATRVTSLGRLGVVAIPVAAAVAAATLAVSALQREANDGEPIKKYAESLGLTAKQMRELAKATDLQVTFMDTLKAVFQVAGGAIMDAIGPALSSVWDVVKDVMGDIWQVVKKVINDIIRSWVISFEMIKILWGNFPAVIGDLFFSAVNKAIDAINSLIQKSVEGVNGFIATANTILSKVGLELPELSAGQIQKVENQYAGAGAAAAAAMNAAAAKEMNRDYLGEFGDAVAKRARENARKRVRDEALDRGYLDPKKGKTDKAAENLQKQLDLLDAQIKGQNALADAYRESDAAAMRAEAMQKAEEDAIRSKAEVGLFYERQLALAVAKRAVEGARTIADLRAQTAAHKLVNEAVRSGLLDASQASSAVQLEATLRPLVAAAANAEGDAKQRLADIMRELRQGQAELNAETARGQALSAIAQNSDEVERMRLEITLIGATNRERAISIAQLEAEQRLKSMPGLTPAEQEGYVQSAVEKAAAQATLTTAQDNYNASLTATYDLLNAISDEAQGTAAALGTAFGSFGEGVGTALAALTDFAAQQQKLDDERREAIKDAGGDAKRLADIEMLYARKTKTVQLDAIGDVAGGFKSMFKQHSTGYKVMEGIERAIALFRLASTLKAITMDATHTGTSIANSAARGAADMASGAAKIFSQLGVWAFPVVAAMVAVLVGLGLKGGGGGGAGVTMPTAEEVQKQQGAGTVLGDAGAKSESIARSLEIMASNTNRDLEYSNQMLRSLRAIESGIGTLAGTVSRQLSLPGGAFDTTDKVGSKSSGGFLGLFGSSTTKTLFDQGVTFAATSLSDAIANGLSGTTYQTIEKVKKKSGFLGIGGGTKTSYSTTTAGLDDDLERQVGLILGSLRESVIEAAKIMGMDVGAALDTFQVEIGKISFKDLKGDEITAALESVFSKVADQMAGFAVQGLAQFQKVGEGAFETLMRLAKDYMTIDVSLRSIGREFGAVGAGSIAAREALIELAGGLDQFVDSVSFYRDNFLTEAEKLLPIQQSVAAEMARLGLAGVTTIDQFKAVVNGIDLTSTAGQELFAALMSVAPAFHEVATAAEEAADVAAKAAAKAAEEAENAALKAAQEAQQRAKAQVQLEVQLLQAMGKAEEALTLQRALELKLMDESLRPLQMQIYAAQDAAKAMEALAVAAQERAQKAEQAANEAAQRESEATQAVADAKSTLLSVYREERGEIEAVADKFRSFAADLRAFRDTLTISASGPAGYKQALRSLGNVANLAASGDEAALGTLPQSAQEFLDVSRNNAKSLLQYQRDVAMVTRYVDTAIKGADIQVSNAEKQLLALDKQVGSLIDITEGVVTLGQAIAQLGTTQAEEIAARAAAERARAAADAAARAAAQAARDKLVITNEAIAQRMASLERLIKNADRGGALAVVNDAATPVYTKEVV
jgi:hypothetical protein